MSSKSKIEWTESTWNPIAGCTKCSPGCKNCYALRMACRQSAMEQKREPFKPFYDRVVDRGKWVGNIICDEKRLQIPLHWRKPRRIFVCSMSDLFHPKVPFEFVDKVYAIAGICPNHTFLMLTKRIARMQEYQQATIAGKRKIGDALRKMGIDCFAYRLLLADAFGGLKDKKQKGQPPYKPFPNIHLGVSICNQKEMDENWPILRSIQAAKKWISFEPTLGLIDSNRHYWSPIVETSECDPHGEIVGSEPKERPDWAVIGCESGPKRRETKELWLKILIEQHQHANVPVFVKVSHNMKEWPDWARIREYPKKGGVK